MTATDAELDVSAGEDTIAAEKRVVIHHIGDLTCVLMVPEGCPTPHVALTVYTHGTADERAAAVRAMGLAGRPVSERDATQWRQHETDKWRATVFLRDGDEHARVTA